MGTPVVLGHPSTRKTENRAQDAGAHSTLVMVLLLPEVFSDFSSVFPGRVSVELTELDLPKWGFPFAWSPGVFPCMVVHTKFLNTYSPIRPFLSRPNRIVQSAGASRALWAQAEQGGSKGGILLLRPACLVPGLGH